LRVFHHIFRRYVLERLFRLALDGDVRIDAVIASGVATDRSNMKHVFTRHRVEKRHGFHIGSSCGQPEKRRFFNNLAVADNIASAYA
jgi:hypothetical protein